MYIMCVSLLNHIKGSGRLLFVFIEKPMYEKCFIRITEQVGKKMSTYGTPRNVECLLNNTSSKHILSLIDLDNYEKNIR